MTQQAPANWYPDPFGRYEHRYWDGTGWTEHVGSAGRQAVDAPVVSPPVMPVAHVSPTAVAQTRPAGKQASKRVQRQVGRLGVADGVLVGGGTLFTEPVLVVNQKAKLFEMKAEYAVFNQHGQKIGAVQEIGFSLTRLTRGGNDGTRRLQIVDTNGRMLMKLTRPAKLLKSKIVVMGADGVQVGQIVQENIGVLASLSPRFNIRFRLESGGQRLGSINAESWRAWDFSIQNAAGAEVARITKTWAGLAKEWLTKADNYVVEIHRPLEEPLRSLVVAAALAVDTALKQDND